MTRLLLTTLAFAALATSAIAADAPRLPKPRPATEPPVETQVWAESAGSRFGDAIDAIDGIARLPRPRPLQSAPLLAMVAPKESDVTVLSPPPAPEIGPGDTACLDSLRALGVEFTEVAPLDPDGECRVAHPLNVTSLGSGVKIGPETILDCTATKSLAEWVKDVVVPTAERTLGAKPTMIAQDSAYVCRNRYGDPNAKLSEHAHGNAIDIAAFDFAGRSPVGIGGSEVDSAEARFETAIRAGACRYFTTVLGPGSNAAHATHFHLDMAERRGGYRLCELGEPKIARGPEKTTRE